MMYALVEAILVVLVNLWDMLVSAFFFFVPLSWVPTRFFRLIGFQKAGWYVGSFGTNPRDGTAAHRPMVGPFITRREALTKLKVNADFETKHTGFRLGFRR